MNYFVKSFMNLIEKKLEQKEDGCSLSEDNDDYDYQDKLIAALRVCLKHASKEMVIFTECLDRYVYGDDKVCRELDSLIMRNPNVKIGLVRKKTSKRMHLTPFIATLFDVDASCISDVQSDLKNELIIFDGKFGLEFSHNRARFFYDEAWAKQKAMQIKSLKGVGLIVEEPLQDKENISLYDCQAFQSEARPVCSQNRRTPFNDVRQRGV